MAPPAKFRGLYARGATDVPTAPPGKRRGPPPHSRCVPDAESGATGGDEGRQRRTRVAFGAAAPGRRVLYSASRVLPVRPPEGTDQADSTTPRTQCQPIVQGSWPDAPPPGVV